MKKQIAFFLIFPVFLLSLAGCNTRYHAEDFIGKTSSQIEKEFGSFDCCEIPMGTDGLYRNTTCGYTLKEPRIGFLGTNPERLLFINFDQNGIAYDIYEGYRPGG